MNNITYTIYAGINGAGKSTLYTLLDYNPNEPRVNPDEILKAFGGDWRNELDQMKAGKISAQMMKEYIHNGISFNQETTLAGKTMERNIKLAKQNGFQVKMYYVGIESADLAKQRISQRVQNGGHGIPDELVEKRYSESLKNLKKIIPMCDQVVIYDNTISLTRAASINNNNLEFKRADILNWVKEALSDVISVKIQDKSLSDTKTIGEEIKKAGYHPTKELINDVKNVNIHFNKSHTIKEICDLYKNIDQLDNKGQAIVQKTASDFIQAEKIQQMPFSGPER